MPEKKKNISQHKIFFKFWFFKTQKVRHFFRLAPPPQCIKKFLKFFFCLKMLYKIAIWCFQKWFFDPSLSFLIKSSVLIADLSFNPSWLRPPNGISNFVQKFF